MEEGPQDAGMAATERATRVHTDPDIRHLVGFNFTATLNICPFIGWFN